jgi:hypothetical protein
MNEQETLPEKPSALVERRPMPTPGQVKTFAQAMFTAKRVAPEVVEQRIARRVLNDKLDIAHEP